MVEAAAATAEMDQASRAPSYLLGSSATPTVFDQGRGLSVFGAGTGAGAGAGADVVVVTSTIAGATAGSGSGIGGSPDTTFGSFVRRDSHDTINTITSDGAVYGDGCAGASIGSVGGVDDADDNDL
jgi:hypothetical protein